MKLTLIIPEKKAKLKEFGAKLKKNIRRFNPFMRKQPSLSDDREFGMQRVKASLENKTINWLTAPGDIRTTFGSLEIAPLTDDAVKTLLGG